MASGSSFFLFLIDFSSVNSTERRQVQLVFCLNSKKQREIMVTISSSFVFFRRWEKYEIFSLGMIKKEIDCNWDDEGLFLFFLVAWTIGFRHE